MNQNTQWKHTMFANKVWKILSVSALAMMISACGGDDDEEEVVGDPVNLTVTVTGSGQIKTASGSIRCGAGGSDCAQTYMEVASEEFTAVPQNGHYFAGWQAAECAGVDAVCMLKISSALTGATDTAYTLKATFKPIAVSAAATYTHNALGQRTSKTVGGVTTFFIYDTAGNLIQELDSTGKPVIETVYLENQAVARIEKSGSTTATRYVHNDHLGAPVMMTNQERKVTWEIETTPFGEPYALYEAGAVQNSRFPGQYWDAETSTSENVMRTYDPSTGRYTQVDSLGLFDGANPYAYVHGNPLNKVDQEGEFALVGAAIGAVGNLAYQMYQNGGDLSCVNWWEVGAWGLTGSGAGIVGRAGLSGIGRFFYDPRKFSQVSKQYWKQRGGAGRNSLDHWLISHARASYRANGNMPAGIVNAGFNLVQMPMRLNSYLGGFGVSRSASAQLQLTAARVAASGSVPLAAGLSATGGYQIGKNAQASKGCGCK